MVRVGGELRGTWVLGALDGLRGAPLATRFGNQSVHEHLADLVTDSLHRMLREECGPTSGRRAAATRPK
eukprot:2722230-Lingulodinium_polyedra.AAC.1